MDGDWWCRLCRCDCYHGAFGCIDGGRHVCRDCAEGLAECLNGCCEGVCPEIPSCETGGLCRALGSCLNPVHVAGALARWWKNPPGTGGFFGRRGEYAPLEMPPLRPPRAPGLDDDGGMV